MSDQDFYLNGWRIEVSGSRITRGLRSVHLEPQVMKVLAFLAHNHDEVVSKNRLIAAVWGHTFVSDAALTRCIFEIRKAFGDDAKASQIVETVPKMGYRLVATLRTPKKRLFFGLRKPLGVVTATSFLSVLLMQDTGTVTSDALYIEEPPRLTRNTLASTAYVNGVSHYEKYTYINNENAIELFEKALTHDPSFGLAYARLSDSLTQQIRYWGGTRLDDAHAAARTAIELAPLQPQSHNAYGVVLELSGRGGEALDSFQRAYALDPTHWQSAYNAAALLKIRLEFEDAIALFEQALEHSPQHVVAMAHLGFLHLRMGDTDNAKQWLDKALNLAPLETYAWSQLATLEMVTGSTAEAIENCQKAREFYPTHRACLHVLGTSNLLDGNMVKAQEWFDYAIASGPDNNYARLGKAQTLFAAGEDEQAMDIIERVLEQSYRDAPDSDDPWEEYWLIAACHALLGNKSIAFSWLEKAAESGRRFYLWDSSDPVFSTLHSDQRFDHYVAMTKYDKPQLQGEGFRTNCYWFESAVVLAASNWRDGDEQVSCSNNIDVYSDAELGGELPPRERAHIQRRRYSTFSGTRPRPGWVDQKSFDPPD